MNEVVTIMNLLKFIFPLLFLVLHPKVESQWVPRPPIQPSPLCVSQFALVNHACSLLPYTPLPPPTPPSPPTPPGPAPSPPAPPSPDQPSRRSRRRHRRSSRHRRHGHHETPIEQDCCRWLKEVDDVCVCELLLHLPPFLIRPVHNYTVSVDESCDVTFSCGSSWIRA